MTEEAADDLLWFVGFDWGSQNHRASVFNQAGRLVGRRDVTHAAGAYAALCDGLIETTQADPSRIGVAIETSHGPVVDMLLDRGFAVFSLNPKQLARFRDRYSPAGAKDDTRDADVLGRSLRTDRDAFRRLSPDHPLVVQMREATRLAEELTRERVRLTNRFRDQLWRYYPQAMKLADDYGDSWFMALWSLAPTPAKGAKLHKETIARLLKEHRIRRLDVDQVRAILREPALVVAPGVVEAASTHIRSLLPRLRLVNSQLKEVHKTIDGFLAALAEPEESEPGQSPEQRDVTILHSLPGVGRIVSATLLSEAPGAVRRRDYQALRTLTGVAPVTRRSGKTCLVTRRLAHNHRLARAVHHWARVAVMHDPTCRARYDGLRQRGHKPARALRGVGDRLLALLCSLLRQRVLFDPHYKEKQAGADARMA